MINPCGKLLNSENKEKSLKSRKINFKLTAYPQEIHKLSTKCGKLVENFGDERVRKLRCVLSSKKISRIP